MATKALTYGAQRASRGRVSSQDAFKRGQDWRAVLISQDADAIWRKLHALVRSSPPCGTPDHDHRTQELFLHLLATDRLSLYLDREFSDEEIRRDLLSLLDG